MKKTILLLLLAIAAITPLAFAGDNDDNAMVKPATQVSERDPFQLPTSVKNKASELNKLAPAAGPEPEEQY